MPAVPGEVLDAALANVFRKDAFLPGQLPVIMDILSDMDVAAVRPTGSGKSLCFQLPGVVDRGLTVVIEPLIALIQDQVANLKALGIAAAEVTSELGEGERKRVESLIQSRQLKFLYTTPERLAQSGFRRLLANAGVSRFVFDEAHCISQWGSSFRPDYAAVGRYLAHIEALAMRRFPRVILTASATRKVLDEVCSILHATPAMHIMPGVRGNIHATFRTVGDASEKMGRLHQFMREQQGAGLIYASTKKACEAVYATLAASGYGEDGRWLGKYHGGMSREERSRAQDAFMHSDSGIMVATKAFGMGVDKSNIRWVAHWNLPDSIDSYVQEVGRAGRDGEPASALLLYSGTEDLKTQNFFIAAAYPERSIIEGVQALAMQYAINNEGRIDLTPDVLAGFATGGASPMQAQRVLDLLVEFGALSSLRDSEGTLYEVVDPNRGVDVHAIAERHTHARLGLASMRALVTETECRSKNIARYYGQPVEHDCGNCDLCSQREATVQQGREQAHTAITCLLRTLKDHPLRVPYDALADLLMGVVTHARYRYIDQLPCFGLLKTWTTARVKRLGQRLLDDGLLDVVNGVLSAHPERATPELVEAIVSQSPPPVKHAPAVAVETAFAERLRSELASLKEGLVAAHQLPANAIFPPALERAVLANPPTSQEALQTMEGMTPGRYAKIGAHLWLAIEMARRGVPEACTTRCEPNRDTLDDLDMTVGF